MSTASINGTGGVRNLRAMFEHKTGDLSTSPPSRGRSPSGSVSSVHSRPVSKVRASFVAVERPGEAGGPPQWGLKKAPGMEDINEKGPGLGAILKGSPFETMFSESDKAALTAPASNKASQQQQHSSTTNGLKLSTTDGAEDPKPNPVPGRPQPKGAASMQSPKSMPIQNSGSKTSIPTDAKPSPNASSGNAPVVRTRGGVSKIQAVMDSANKAKQARLSTAQTTQPKPTPSTTNDVKQEPVSSSKAARPPSLSMQSRGSVTVAKAPGSAALPTASSAAKHEVESSNKSTQRKSSVKGPPRVANATTASSLAKKHSRASLNTEETSKPRTSMSKAADEGFLARMMRPTTSSAQKTHDKPSTISPPRSRKVPDGGKATMKKGPRKSAGSSTTLEEDVDYNNHNAGSTETHENAAVAQEEAAQSTGGAEAPQIPNGSNQQAEETY